MVKLKNFVILEIIDIMLRTKLFGEQIAQNLLCFRWIYLAGFGQCRFKLVVFVQQFATHGQMRVALCEAAVGYIQQHSKHFICQTDVSVVVNRYTNAK